MITETNREVHKISSKRRRPPVRENQKWKDEKEKTKEASKPAPERDKPNGKSRKNC